MQFSEEKKAPLDRVGQKVKKKILFFFLGSAPKIGSVGTWETYNQLDVPLGTSMLCLWGCGLRGCISPHKLGLGLMLYIVYCAFLFIKRLNPLMLTAAKSSLQFS